MQTATLGKENVTAKVGSTGDSINGTHRILKPEQVRSVEVTDALVDTGATNLSMPRRLITQLGLQPFRTRRARTSAGAVTLQVYGTVRLTVQGRDCHCDVVELPDDCPVLV